METQYERVFNELNRLFAKNVNETYSVRTVLSFQKEGNELKPEKNRAFNQLLIEKKIKIVDLVSENKGAPAPYYQNIRGNLNALKILTPKDDEYVRLNLFILPEYCKLNKLSEKVRKRIAEILIENQIPAYAVKDGRYTFKYRKIDIDKALEQYNKEANKGVQLSLEISKAPLQKIAKEETSKASSLPVKKLSKSEVKAETSTKIKQLFEKEVDKAYRSSEIAKMFHVSKARAKDIIRVMIKTNQLKVVKVEGDAFLTVSYQGINGSMPEIPAISNTSKEYRQLKLISTNAFREKYDLAASQTAILKRKSNDGEIPRYLVKDEKRGYFWNSKEDDLLKAYSEISDKPIKKKRKPYKKHNIIAPIKKESMAVQPQASLSGLRKLLSFNFLNFNITITKKKQKETISNSKEDSIEL